VTVAGRRGIYPRTPTVNERETRSEIVHGAVTLEKFCPVYVYVWEAETAERSFSIAGDPGVCKSSSGT